jgi:trehalose/maltose hydrolase-like predicted phosphorylase
VLKKAIWVVLVPALLSGCRHSAETSKTYPAPKPDPWVLSCLDPTNPTPALLWNGLIGVRVGRDGTGLGPQLVEADRQALPFFTISEYEPRGEENIQPLPNPLAVSWAVNGNPLDPGRGDDYSQTLDMRTGVLTTCWSQPFGEAKLGVKCEDVVCPGERVIAQRWTLTGVPRALMEFRSSVEAAPGAFQPTLKGASGDTADYLCSPGGAVAHVTHAVSGAGAGSWQTQGGAEVWRGDAHGGETVTLDRVVQCLAASVGSPAKAWSFDAVRSESEHVWADRWKTDIQIDGPVEDQQAVRSFLFYLRSAIDPHAGMAISPMGLSSQTYNGHVFWDADIWVFPALALVDPQAAKAIPDYRLKMFASHFSPSKGGGPFPWESSVSGKEVAPPAMRNEIHISGDVAFMLNQAAEVGLADPEAASRVRDAAEAYYLHRSFYKPGASYELRGVTSPDENHTGDNDLYTNLLAEWCSNRPERNTHFEFKRPADSQSYLTYDGDAVRSYKQAAAVLAIYPLQMVEDKQARVMMDRFADKVTKNGPAMSQSVHALIWARLGESRKAYETWRESWQGYTHWPLLLFSEKPNKEAAYFTTGAAGCLQTVIYGFLGFRIDCNRDYMTAWSHDLNGSYRLNIKPSLPAAWKSVTFKNFTVRGVHYTLTVDAHGVKVTQGES